MAGTVQRERTAALALAEASLWLVLVGGFLGVLALLRELAATASNWNPLSWANPVVDHLPRWLPPIFDPSLPATLDANSPEVKLPFLEWVQTSNGTVDAATGLPPVSISPPIRPTVNFPALSDGQNLVRLAPALLLALGLIAGSWLLLRIVRSARAGEVFTMANAVRLRWLAVVIGVGGLLHNAIAALGPNWILSQSAAAAYLDTSAVTISFAPVSLALIIAALAVIWEHGVRLAQDADGLV